MGLNLDPQFVRDLSILIAASALGGLVMEALGQPTINGYFIAGSAVGPGGLKLVKELVQVSWGRPEVARGLFSRRGAAGQRKQPGTASSPWHCGTWLSWNAVWIARI